MKNIFEPRRTKEEKQKIKTGKAYQGKKKYMYFVNAKFFRQTFMDKDCRILIHANTK